MKFPLPALLLPALARSSQGPVGTSSLGFSVYNTDETPTDHPPHQGLTFSPISITLVQSAHEVLLVDAPITISQTNSLIDYIKQTVPTKRPTALYITHGHGDHFFGAPLLREAFPGLKVLATQSTIEHIKDTLEPAYFAALWEPLFPGQIPDQDQVLTFIEALPSDGKFRFDGHEVRAVELGESDTYNTTALHVPDIGLVVAGDVVYGHYHQFFGESNTTALQDQWIAALDKIATLKPQHVVPGHMYPDEGYSPEHLPQTKAYIRAWQQEVKKAKSQDELVSAMQKRYPKRGGEFILRLSASSNTELDAE